MDAIDRVDDFTTDFESVGGAFGSLRVRQIWGGFQNVPPMVTLQKKEYFKSM